DDPNYRYKMEKPVVTKLKTTTELTNIDAVCKDLGRDVGVVIEFLKKKFGVNFTLKNGKYITTKPLTYDELDLALREFIEYFVCYMGDKVFIKVFMHEGYHPGQGYMIVFVLVGFDNLCQEIIKCILFFGEILAGDF